MEHLLWRQLEEIQSGSNMNSTDSSSSSTNDQDAAEMVKIFLLPCIVVVICLVLLSNRACMLMDRYCCFFHPTTLPPEEFDHGPVAKKAGLWGLRQSERMLILKHIFERTTFAYEIEEKSRMQDATDDKKATVSCTVDTCTQESGGDNEEFGSEKEENQPSNPLNTDDLEARIRKQTDPSTDDSSSSTIDDEVDIDDEVCCICLAECENGCQLMMGTRCNHFFHPDCCMEWLQKHDHCPYCREEMMSPREMREAAIQLLGPDRVTTMRQVHQHAEEAPSDDLESGMSVASTHVDSSGDDQ